MGLNPIILPSPPTIGRLLRVKPQEPEASDEIIGTSQLGTPVFSNLIFDADQETPEKVAIVLDTVLMEVYQPRHIIKTRVAGRSGSVKEYISDGDFEITARGALVSPERDVRPTEVMEAMYNLFKIKREISVSSNFLSPLGVTDVVIDNYRFYEEEGFYNMIPFEIMMISDEPFEIKVNDIQTY